MSRSSAAPSPRSPPPIWTTVREARRAALLSVSDESLYEYAAYTRVILGVINRLDLYKEYRVH